MERANHFYIHFFILFAAALPRLRIGRSLRTVYSSTAIVAALLVLPPELTRTVADTFTTNPWGTLQLI